MTTLDHPLYTAYGLSIASELALPELVLDTSHRDYEPKPGSAPDVTIHLGAALEPGRFEVTEENLRADPEGEVLAWHGVGRFSLKSGSWVLVQPQANVPEQLLRAFLLGPVLAALLFQRGFLVLHASAVALPNAGGEWGAVAFMGNSGAGKSTMAASLHARGFPLVADDYIAVSPQHGTPGQDSSQHPTGARPFIFPGYARLRLLPSSLAALGLTRQAPPVRRDQAWKHTQRATRGFSRQKLPLRCVYVLDVGADLLILPLQPAHSIVEIARHAYFTSIVSPHENAAQFRRCGALANDIPVRGLQRPRDLARLSEVAQAVEADQEA